MFPIEQKIVIAASSSAVFDMSAAQRIFDEQGLETYRHYQRQRVDDPFQKGGAFPSSGGFSI